MIQDGVGEMEGVRARGRDGLHVQNFKGIIPGILNILRPQSSNARFSPVTFCIMMACEPSEVEKN